MELKLGENKTVTITPWKSKTKKEFIKLFKRKEDKVNEQDIIDVLVIPYIQEKETYYSPDEIQYILIKLREISITDEINFSMDCDNKECGKNFDIETNLGNISSYQPNKYPTELNNVTWRDLPAKDSLTKMIKKYPDEPPRSISMILHIETINGELISSFQQLINIVDDLSMRDADDLERDYNLVSSKLDIKQNIKCTHCGFEKEYLFDIIPTFFDPLLPKDM